MDWGRLAFYLRMFVSDTLDSIVPPHAHTLRTKSRQFEDVPLSIRQHELLSVTITTLMEYREPAVQDLIRSLKYDGDSHAATLCARALADYLREETATLRNFSPRPILIVPLPLHENRKRERGFNQIERILDALPPPFKDGRRARVTSDILVRTRDTPHQTSLSRLSRMKNMKGAFAVVNPQSVRGARIFVVDDVTTTGATLASAHAALRRAGAETFLLALARA